MNFECNKRVVSLSIVACCRELKAHQLAPFVCYHLLYVLVLHDCIVNNLFESLIAVSLSLVLSYLCDAYCRKGHVKCGIQ